MKMEVQSFRDVDDTKTLGLSISGAVKMFHTEPKNFLSDGSGAAVSDLIFVLLGESDKKVQRFLLNLEQEKLIAFWCTADFRDFPKLRRS